jgi:DNA mismatch endonuclease (patch repair protein)
MVSAKTIVRQPRPTKKAKRPPLSRSENMARIRSKGTKPEACVGRLLFAEGLRYRKHVKGLPGCPDFANHKRRWAVFVNGCFWHSHRNCHRASKPKSNQSYWEPKLAGNALRDRENTRRLRRLGYLVIVIWECETVRNARVIAKVRKAADRVRQLAKLPRRGTKVGRRQRG